VINIPQKFEFKYYVVMKILLVQNMQALVEDGFMLQGLS